MFLTLLWRTARPGVLWGAPLFVALGLTLWLSGAAQAAHDSPLQQTTPVTVTAAPSMTESGQGTAAAVPALPVALEPVTPLTVTILGIEETDAETTDALTTFLRFLIAAYSYYGPYAGPVTATVGALPAHLPVELPLPADVPAIGSLARSGLYGETQLFLKPDGPVAEFVEGVRTDLLEQGFAPLPTEGFYQVFVSLPAPDPGPLCSPDKEYTVTFAPQAVVGAGEALAINLNPVQSMGNLCNRPAYAPVDLSAQIFPQLLPPPDTLVQSSGGGGGGNYVSAEAQLESSLTAAELSEHYEAQLVKAGWARLEQSAAGGAVAWSAWSFTDAEEQAWTATFTIVRKGGEENDYLADLRADADD
jgi:hypothetical protein